MQADFAEFLKAPDPGRFRGLQDALFAHETYEPHADYLTQMKIRLQRADNDGAIRLFAACMPNLLLSPKAHTLLSYAHKNLQRPNEAEMELAVGSICLNCLLQTGRGSAAAPYRVTRISDETDILKFQGRKAQAQRLVHEDDRYYDHVLLEDETECVFDVTGIYSRD